MELILLTIILNILLNIKKKKIQNGFGTKIYENTNSLFFNEKMEFPNPNCYIFCDISQIGIYKKRKEKKIKYIETHNYSNLEFILDLINLIIYIWEYFWNVLLKIFNFLYNIWEILCEVDINLNNKILDFIFKFNGDQILLDILFKIEKTTYFYKQYFNY